MNTRVRQIILLGLCFWSVAHTQAQTMQDQDKKPTRITYKDVEGRARDHTIIQFGSLNWADKPDTLRTRTINKQFRISFMHDVLMKGFPYMSVGFGAGFAWDNLYLKDGVLDISANNFNKAQIYSSTKVNHYKKSKLTNVYLDIPLELRFTTNPLNYNKGFKIAVGMAYGVHLKSYTKGSKLLDENGSTLSNGKTKVIDSRYFASSRVLGTLRIGYGAFHIFASYQLTSPFTNKGGPDVRPFVIGIGLNGL